MPEPFSAELAHEKTNVMRKYGQDIYEGPLNFVYLFVIEVW